MGEAKVGPEVVSEHLMVYNRRPGPKIRGVESSDSSRTIHSYSHAHSCHSGNTVGAQPIITTARRIP